MTIVLIRFMLLAQFLKALKMIVTTGNQRKICNNPEYTIVETGHNIKKSAADLGIYVVSQNPVNAYQR